MIGWGLKRGVLRIAGSGGFLEGVELWMCGGRVGGCWFWGVVGLGGLVRRAMSLWVVDFWTIGIGMVYWSS